MSSNFTLFVCLGLLLAGICFTTESYSQLAPSRTPTTTVQNYSNFFTYENSSFGIKIRYPSDWKQIKDFRGSWFRNANESVNVRVESIPYELGSLDELTNRQLNLTEQQFPAQVLVESKATTMGDNYTAHEIVFTFPEVPSDLRHLTEFKEMQIFTINRSRAYIISFFTTNDTYNNYTSLVQKIIDSFRIT